MSGTINWRFPPLSGGTKQGFNNNDIEAFKGEYIIDNLAREVCQNSLDAKSAKAVGPVRVSFKLEEVERSLFPLFDQYEGFIQACKEYYTDNMGHQLENFLDSAELMLKRDHIPILVVRDYNTTGLKGSHTRDIKDPWEALTSADGISAGKDEGSGGSYGIGKNAPFACSAMRMVFYNTLDEDNESAFIGVGRLATFHDKALDDDTQRVGRYQNNQTETGQYLPIYPSDKDGFRDLFVREKGQIGTDVIIAGFAYSDNWARNVEKAIAKNFFVAIANNTLVVDIVAGNESITIDADSLAALLERLKDEGDMSETLHLYEAYTKPDYQTTLTIESENDVEVRIISRPDIGKKIANFRNTGMLIDTYYRRIWQNYACVVVVTERGLSDLLKKTEPAKHDNWDAKRIQGDSESAKHERKRARDAINAIRDKVRIILVDLYERAPEKTVDAAGVGDYLPDAADPSAGNGNGDDALRPIVKVGKVKTKGYASIAMAESNERGKKGIGVPTQGDVHNQTDAPPNSDPLPVTPSVDPDLPGQQVGGVLKGSGTKRITSKFNYARRTFAISSKSGIYRSIIRSSRDIPNALIEFSVAGEDGRDTALELVKCTYKGKAIPLKNGKIGPVSLIADTDQEFTVTFDTKEKMLINARVIEVND